MIPLKRKIFTLYYSKERENPTNTRYPIKATIATSEGLAQVAAYDHVGGCYRGNHRGNKDFISADCLPMDLDNDPTEKGGPDIPPEEWKTPEDVAQIFSDVPFYAVQSRNHLKEKDGRPARPRHHYYFPLDAKIESADLLAGLKQAVRDYFPAFDDNAVDAARFFYGVENPHVEYHDGSTYLDTFMELKRQEAIMAMSEPAPSSINETQETPPPESTAPINEGVDTTPPAGRGRTIPAGERNAHLSHFAGRVLKRYGDKTDKAIEAFREEAAKCEPPLEQRELATIWTSALKFFRETVSVAPGYVPPDAYGLQKAGAGFNLSEAQLKELALFPATDTGNAERLRLAVGDTIRYLPEKGRGAAWYKWNGKQWEAVFENSLYNMVTDIMLLAKKKAQQLLKDPKTDSKELNILEPMAEFLKTSCNQNKIDSCLKRARGVFDGRITDFDQDNFLLNVQNGIVDLKTGELLPHDKSKMCSKICRAEYIPYMRGAASLWTKTIEAIIPDEQERRYLQKWAGYMLTGSAAEEKLLFLYGEGGSGKGTFLNTIGWMMGDYADTVDIEIFLSSRNDGHAGGAAASPEIAKLAGLRTAIASESGVGRKMNDAKVKNLTGRDDITARFLYGQQFTFSPMVKFLIMSNYLPAVTDATDSGIARRLVIAPFMEDLEAQRDIHLKEKLKEPENLSAVLAWCVEGCLMWQKEGLGEPPERYARQARRFYADSDTLQQFIDDECITGPGAEKRRARVKDFHQRYQDWTGERIKRKSLVDLMERRGYPAHRFTEGRCFVGLELKYGYDYGRQAFSSYP